MATNAATALNEKLQQVLTGGGGVPPGAFISGIGGGKPVDPDSLSWAAEAGPFGGDPGTPEGKNADNARDFASVVNTIPTDAGPWFDGGSKLGLTYRDTWLQSALVPNVALTADQMKDLKAAQKTIDDKDKTEAYETTRANWESANLALQLAVLSPRGTGYLATLLQARQEASRALVKWQSEGRKAEYEHALDINDHYSGIGFVHLIEKLKTDYDQTLQENLDTSAKTFTPVRLYPNNPFALSSWPKFSISTSEFSQYTSSTTQSRSSGFDVGFLFWSVAHGGSSSWDHVQASNIQIQDLEISFEFLRVKLDRSAWFDTGLLMSRSWWWPGATKSNPTIGGPTFNDGRPIWQPESHGQWPMIPTEMVLTRNLKVTAKNFDLQNSSWAHEVSSGSGGGFLFFGTSSHSKSNLAGSYNHTFASKSTLVSAQPQISAFICQTMPKEPNPDTNLLP